MLKTSEYIVTSGSRYIDIDALACCMAYNQLLKWRGFQSHAILSPKTNVTVPLVAHKWAGEINKPTQYSNSFFKNKRYCIMDVSNPEHFDHFVNLDNIDIVFDHHFGFEEYWRKKDIKSYIVPIGACATLVYEEFKKYNLLSQIDKYNANLLLTAILSNTLFFKAQVTNKRDIDAYNDLLKFADVDQNWISEYFSEVTQSVKNDFLGSINSDYKNFELKNDSFWVGQLELWNLRNAESEMTKLSTYIESLPAYAFANIVNISEGHSLIVGNNEKTIRLIDEILDGRITHKNIFRTKKPILRKEIIRDLNNHVNS